MQQDMWKHGHSDGINLNTMIFLSCVFHIIVLMILVFAPSIPSPKWTFGPIYSVQLVSLSETLMDKGAQSSLSREIFQDDKGRSSVVVAKKSEAVQTVPIKRIDVQTDRESIVAKALENLKKNSTPAQRQEEQHASGAGTNGQTGDRLKPASGKSGAADGIFNRYYAEIWSRIRGQWAFPPGLSQKENYLAIIHVTILKNGTATELQFEKRSGNRFFDESAMRAVRKASPFPPLPAEIGESSVDLGIRFHSQELNK
ncbi:MAG: TonB family protein [Deltaproteobacteria bacterium]|nr:TonB family protein [Deltaproteobacteria bacterium]